MPVPEDVPAEPDDVGRLIELAARFLRSMQLDDGSFCLERVRGEAEPRGRSVRYSLMTYIGLGRAEAAGHRHGFDLDAIRSAAWRELDAGGLRPGELGLYLWADAVRGSQAGATELAVRAERALAAAGGPATLETQEVSWLTVGLARNRVARESPPGENLLRTALADLAGRHEPATGLLYHYGGPHRRRRFANFASQIYGLLALAVGAKEGLGERSLAAAREVADRLIALQLPDGGWPWLYDVARGTVLERYEVYSVHQHAMAPMGLLELAEASGESRYRAAALRGLGWIHGRNELGLELVDEEEELIYRSIRRASPFARPALYAGTAAALVLGRGLRLPTPVELNATCRPYELGWLLEAWSGREAAA